MPDQKLREEFGIGLEALLRGTAYGQMSPTDCLTFLAWLAERAEPMFKRESMYSYDMLTLEAERFACH